jgi:hypothetical protein
VDPEPPRNSEPDVGSELSKKIEGLLPEMKLGELPKNFFGGSDIPEITVAVFSLAGITVAVLSGLPEIIVAVSEIIFGEHEA